MDNTNYTLLASLVGLAVVLVRVLELLVTFIIKKLGDNKEDERNKLIYTINNQLSLLIDWHSKTDDGGRFVWFVNPEILESLKALLEQSNDSAYAQRDLIKGFDKVICVLEKIDRKQDILDSQKCGAQDCPGRI